MSARRLVLYVPGINRRAKAWDPLIARLRRDLEEEQSWRETTWKAWDHGVHVLSFGTAMRAAQELRDRLDAEWLAAGGYDEIILVGHSMGGLLVRQAYLLATGGYEGEHSSNWWRSVRRFVLLAAINRGFDLAQIRIRISDILSRTLSFLCLGRRMVVQDFMRGSEFITDLRLRWIGLMRELPIEQPMIIQILGSRDSLVTREDSVDLEQFPNAYHWPVPGARHGDLPLIERGEERELRYTFIRDAILGRHLERAEEPLKYEKKERVFFVLHGIRAANRDWVSDLDREIKAAFPNSEVVTPSYGYLSALEFALPFLHSRPIRIFQSYYSDYFAINPGAPFHFIGHSNGTYILGRSLLSLSGMKFDRVVLAGSVLPRKYPWRKLLGRQVKAVRNDQANRDWPVGILCSALTGLGRREIGTGGYEGFFDDDNNIVQNSFYNGGHGQALEPDNFASIMAFLREGPQAPRPAGLVGERRWFSLLSRISPWLARGLLVALVALPIAAIIQSSLPLLAVWAAGIALLALFLKVL